MTERPSTITRCLAGITAFAVWAATCLVVGAPLLVYEVESVIGPTSHDTKVVFVCPDALAHRVATPGPKNDPTPSLVPSDPGTTPVIVRVEARAHRPAVPRLRRPLGVGIVVLRI